MKTEESCSICHECKPISEFHRNASRPSGYSKTCKPCSSDYNKARLKRMNAEGKKRLRKDYGTPEYKSAKAAHDAAYYAANKEVIRKRLAEKRKANPKRFSQYYQKWKMNNLEKCLAAGRATKAKLWRTDPERVKIHARNRRARKLCAEGKFTQKEWLDLCKKANHCCLRCGKKTKLSVDHIVPIARGGSNYIDNIQPLCRSCNSAKGARNSIDYRTSFGF